jgi:hypothetical protein
MTPSTAQTNATTTSSGTSNEEDITILLTKRRNALHNLDYTPLASRHDIGGYCSDLPNSPLHPLTRRGSNNAVTGLDEGCLSTPLMDISGMCERGVEQGSGEKVV